MEMKGHFSYCGVVAEVKVTRDRWVAFLSERLSAELDDVFKKYHHNFDYAARVARPEELLHQLPMRFPMSQGGSRLRRVSCG